MENYIMINGKKIKLITDQLDHDQLLALYKAGLISPVDTLVKEKFNPAKRKPGQLYYGANPFDVSCFGVDTERPANDECFDYANYWNDKAFAKHVALNQLFYRKLLQYAYLNDLVDDKPWDGETEHIFIAQHVAGRFMTSYTWNGKMPCTVYFKSEAAANKAIENVVEPFMVEHPDFRLVW